jgi:hypothetical protein
MLSPSLLAILSDYWWVAKPGSWMSGAIFDLTGSYWQAFVNGLGWNLLNIAIGLVLLLRLRARVRPSMRGEGARAT